MGREERGGRGWGWAEGSVLGFRCWRWEESRGHLGRNGQGSRPGKARRAVAKGPVKYQDLVQKAQSPRASSAFVSSGAGATLPWSSMLPKRGRFLRPLGVRTSSEQDLGRGVTLRRRAVSAGVVRGAATWLALRAGVPDRGRHHHAAVPAQALRRPSYPPLLVRALAFSVHLHQDFGKHAWWAERAPGRVGPPSGGL